MINAIKFAIDYIFHFWGIVGTLATVIGMAYGLWVLLGVFYKWLYVNIHPFREISDCLILIYFLPKIRLSFSRGSLEHYIKNSTEQYRQNTFGRRVVFKAISKRLESMDAAVKKSEPEVQDEKPPFVTLAWDGYPTIQLKGGYVLPRKAEMIINRKYYPTGTVGEWPVCPETKEKLKIAKK